MKFMFQNVDVEIEPVHLDDEHVIDQPDMVMHSIHTISDEQKEWPDVEAFMRANPKLVFYFDAVLHSMNDADPDAAYCWIDTGARDRQGRHIFVSCMNRQGKYTGHYTSNAEYLAKKIASYAGAQDEEFQKIIDRGLALESDYDRYPVNPVVPAVKEKEASKEKTVKIETKTVSVNAAEAKAVLNEVEPLLMVNKWKSSAGLLRYINIIGDRLTALTEKEKTAYYVKNKTGCAAVNTGLIDRYGRDILIIYRYYIKDNRYHPFHIVSGKQDLLDNGFTMEDASQELLPVNFFDENEPSVFEGTLRDFDINLRSLSHVIKDRRDRFPETASGLSDSALAGRMEDAIELGLKMQERDHSFIRASYSTEVGGISWIFPFHICSDISEEPEMALVVRKAGEFFTIKTVMPYDDALRDRLRCMALYS